MLQVLIRVELLQVLIRVQVLLVYSVLRHCCLDVRRSIIPAKILLCQM